MKVKSKGFIKQLGSKIAPVKKNKAFDYSKPVATPASPKTVMTNTSYRMREFKSVSEPDSNICLEQKTRIEKRREKYK